MTLSCLVVATGAALHLVMAHVANCNQLIFTAMNELARQALRRVVMALHDEQPGIRKVTVAIIGQLCHLNPAYGLPAPRSRLVELTGDLGHASSTDAREEAAAPRAST